MRKIYVLLIGVALLCVWSPVFAINTAKIDVVRSKETLAEADTAVIEQFLADALSEFFEKTDFSDVAALRTAIISRSTSSLESGQIQYGPRFFTAAEKEISNNAKKINDLGESYRKTLLTTNLLILVNDLGNIEVSKAAFEYLQSPNVIIRYWAVNCLTNADMIRQLNMESDENRRLGQEFIQRLTPVAQAEESGDILAFIAQFAAELKQQPSANDLLTTIANKRIDLYLNWKVNDEMTDIAILKALADRAKTDAESSKVTAKNFSILYSVIIQRYVLGDQLGDTNKSSLVSVITQSEKLVTGFISDWPGSLKRALEKGGGAGLLAEHDSLFGSASAAGKLPTTAGFDYGKNPDGTVKNAPPALQKPPAK